MLKRLKVQGITIVVATPYMDEANLCDRIALIQNGKILSIDTPKAIAASYPDKLYAVKADKMSNMIKALNQYEHALSCYGFGEFAHVSVDKKLKGEVKAMKSYLEQHGLNDIEIEAIDASIEDCFIKLLS